MKPITINMPEMCLNGLSENWLFKYAGDRHWAMLCRSLGCSSSDLVDESGNRLYSSFVAIRLRADQPLSAVGENEVLNAHQSIARYGQSFFQSEMALERTVGGCIHFEMLTAFVFRTKSESNELRRSNPSPDFDFTGTELSKPPLLLTTVQDIRRRQIVSHDFVGHSVPLEGSSLDLRATYQPSPYTDFNGANLLYFAAYPTISDTLERVIVLANGLHDRTGDWAMATSTVARDVFYYSNLALGQNIVVSLRRCEQVNGDQMLLHTVLLAATDEKPLGEIFTLKARV